MFSPSYLVRALVQTVTLFSKDILNKVRDSKIKDLTSITRSIGTITNHFRFRNLEIKFEHVKSLRNQTEISYHRKKRKESDTGPE